MKTGKLVSVQSILGSLDCIINTDDHTKPGDHWVAIIKEKKGCFYFDSLGFPIYKSDILDVLKNNKINKYKYNCQQIQPLTSSTCGLYCIAFILSYVHGDTYEDFLKRFYTNPDRNDNICLDFINKYIS